MRKIAVVLEEIVAKAEGIIAGAIAKAVPTVAGLAYRVRVEGAGVVDKERAAIFAIKHTSMVDFAISTYVFGKVIKKQVVVPVKEGLFKNHFLALILKELGAEPMTRPKDGGYMPQSAERFASNRVMMRHLRSKGGYAYCPEGTRVRGAVGEIEPSSIHPLMMAERLDANVYVGGFEYQTPRWLPLWIPLVTRVVVRGEPYEVGDKGVEKVTAEIRAAMARLSGLEGKLMPGYTVRNAEGTSAAVSRQK